VSKLYHRNPHTSNETTSRVAQTISPLPSYSKIKLKLYICACICMHACVYVRTLIAWKLIHHFAPNLACLFLETRKRFSCGQKSENVSLVRLPVRVVSVARELSMIQERRQDKNCLLRRDYRNEGHNPEKSALGSSPGEDSICSSKTERDKWTAPRPTFLFQRGDYGDKGHNPE
jgi:hypothetical protein